VPVVGRRRIPDEVPVDEEMHQLDSIRWPVELLERLDEDSRGRTGSPDEDPIPRSDERDRLGRRLRPYAGHWDMVAKRGPHVERVCLGT
jgi:hypothetical protein